LAIEAAKLNKLPPITKAEDVLENYSTTNTLTLAYRMGLVTRPEWRRLQRAYGAGPGSALQRRRRADHRASD
jgi:hypothetical protein